MCEFLLWHTHTGIFYININCTVLQYLASQRDMAIHCKFNGIVY